MIQYLVSTLALQQQPEISPMMKPHSKTVATGLIALAAFATTTMAQIASDNAGNIAYTGGFSVGTNGGFGFNPWTINSNNGGNGSAGSFIGNPSTGGITGMSASSFGLYANPTGSGASVDADRSFAAPLQVGQSFSFDWGINFDSGAGGAKGFNLYTGAPGVDQIVNVNNGGDASITVNGVNTGFSYGTNVMTWTFTYTSSTRLDFTANDRDGTGTYSGNVTISAAPNSFRFYAFQMQAGDSAQPYFNNLTVVPEPSTYALLGLGAASILWRFRRRRVS
jgi:hypothetical protein